MSNPDALDRIFLDRTFELAARGIGNTSPNPPVGAVVVRDGRVIGEGYHHRAGEAHAEVNALAQAGDARGATVYVSLEPCNHVGRTAACSHALVDAGVGRVVVGTVDPNPRTNGAGIAYLRERGVRVDVTDDRRAQELIERFTFSVRSDRPYVALKMAMSLDGCITSRPGVQEWLTSEEERLHVRDLRVAYDAVMVGAGTVRVDDPQLTVRPPHHRLRPLQRIVACETDTVPAHSRVFANVEDYAPTIVLAPAGRRANFANLRETANVLFVGDDRTAELDLADAMRALRSAGVQSVLCEGGPTLGARLLASGVVNRVYWAIAPVLLSNESAVPVLAGADLASLGLKIDVDVLERIGTDIVVSGRVARV